MQEEIINTKKKVKLVQGWGINDVPNSTVTIKDGKKVLRLDYNRWNGILQRSCSPIEKARKPGYADSFCNESWKYFSKFQAWLNTQPYWEVLQLDKDILFRGNKEYGPDTCAFVPIYLNSLLQFHQNKGTNLLGATKGGKGNSGKYVSFTSNPFSDTNNHLGTFNTEMEAHKAWQVGKAYAIECAIHKYAQEPWFRTDVADALMARVWELRLHATTGVITTKL